MSGAKCIRISIQIQHTFLKNFDGLLDRARYRIGYAQLANEVDVDVLLFLILDRNAFGQNLVNEPFEVHFAWTNDLL